MNPIQEIRTGTDGQANRNTTDHMGAEPDQEMGDRVPAERLGPREIRSKRFRIRRFGCRGFDPDEVRGFLGRIAAEIIALRAELANVRAENARMRATLTQRQARQPVRLEAAGPVLPNSSRRYGRG